jgi:AcrR family transcriptional regulator/predicted DNA-binding transcriptional regulator AlpA
LGKLVQEPGAMARTFPIHELVQKTGVPRATIHHYVRFGLLPEPERASSNRFLYDSRHVQGLRLIRVLRERRGLSLDVIGVVLPQLIGLRRDQAFKADMWERLLETQLGDPSDTRGARLLDAAVGAFSKRDYEEVNVDEICSIAGIAKGSFYKHFSSKEELFFSSAEKAAEDVVEDFGKRLTAADDRDDGVVEALRAALEWRLPLFLQLLTRALQRSPGYRPVALRVSKLLNDGVAGQLEALGRSPAGAEIFSTAVGRLIGGVLSDPSHIQLK